jgi:pimeloyl-ACP methyl ester carboxylesterase
MTDEIRRRYVKAWSEPGALTGALNYYRSSPLYPPTSSKDKERIRNIVELPREMFKVNVATLVIWGELDQALPVGNLDGLEDYVDELVVKRIPDGTHWVIHEKPEVVSLLIREFL